MTPQTTAFVIVGLLGLLSALVHLHFRHRYKVLRVLIDDYYDALDEYDELWFRICMQEPRSREDIEKLLDMCEAAQRAKQAAGEALTKEILR